MALGFVTFISTKCGRVQNNIIDYNNQWYWTDETKRDDGRVKPLTDLYTIYLNQ